MTLRVTSDLKKKKKHCPSRPALAPDFSLFIECNFMLERELTCWLCSRKAVQWGGHFTPRLPWLSCVMPAFAVTSVSTAGEQEIHSDCCVAGGA